MSALPETIGQYRFTGWQFMPTVTTEAMTPCDSQRAERETIATTSIPGV